VSDLERRRFMRAAWARRQGYATRTAVSGGEGVAVRSGWLVLPYQRQFYGPRRAGKAARDLAARPPDLLAPVTITVGPW
jgi:hypothetical protein